MKIADLYIRVSTDEQADRGYSQRSQEEVLRKYCELNKIEIRKVIYEDHSAKTFMRPKWISLIEHLKKFRNRTNFILFTKWDRFSRNAPDAYQMISVLKKLGVEPQAIEQPLDMSVPENKMMLAIYLTAPEIENDRRALNTMFGMRRARKEGRWTSKAPIGYRNRSTPDGKTRFIEPNEEQARIMKWAFHEIADGKYSTEQVYKRAKALGLHCNKNNFLVTIRNPVYCGLITISAYGDEKAFVVKGQHKAIISQSLFYEVQDILNGKKRKIKTTILSNNMLPLRGFIDCSNCSRTLCASASKGRNNYYYYYHCSSACGYRQKAEVINELFIAELQQYVLRQESVEHFRTAILDSFINLTNSDKESKIEYIKEITEQNNRITKARELLLSGDIDGTDYKTIKTEAEKKIFLSEAKLSELPSKTISITEVETVLDTAISKLTKLNVIYCKSDIKSKREIIGSMFPEKFTFEELQHRTAKVDILFQIIYLTNNKLEVKKEGQATVLPCLPIMAPSAGLEPATL